MEDVRNVWKLHTYNGADVGRGLGKRSRSGVFITLVSLDYFWRGLYALLRYWSLSSGIGLFHAA